MKSLIAVLVFLFFFLCIHAQKTQTIVPRQVVVGNAFQVQYVINDPSAFINISTPQFENLRLISGPNYYKGSSLINGKAQSIENIVYTVVPVKTGVVKIYPVTANFKNSKEETDEVVMNAIPQPKASFNALSTYTDINLYAPSSNVDRERLIESNLFIKTEVDKRVCFLGDALTATFKLYSRLQSTSEVLNAPSLYGFSVIDILNINEAHQAVETINGKVFNTSVLRKLQLYPTQTGTLTIDAMQLQNTIEFDDSSTGEKIKVEKLLASNPVDIVVKPLPLQKPADYSGAVGHFIIKADLSDPKIEENTQGRLTITISGKGNFIQFGPPFIPWPKGFDVFDPIVSDELNKNAVPTEGERKYIFNFTTNRIGNFIISPVSLSFFDPSSHKYKTTSSDSLKLEIVPSSDKKSGLIENERAHYYTKPWMYFILIPILLICAALFIWSKKKQKNVRDVPIEKPNYVQRLNDIPVQQLPGKQFCFEIQKLLKEVSKEYNLSQEQKKELQAIQNDCQLFIYSDVEPERKQEELKKRAGNFLNWLAS